MLLLLWIDTSAQVEGVGKGHRSIREHKFGIQAIPSSTPGMSIQGSWVEGNVNDQGLKY